MSAGFMNQSVFFTVRQSPGRVATLAATTVVSVAAWVWWTPSAGAFAGALSLVPAVAGGWWFGRWGAVLATLVECALFNLVARLWLPGFSASVAFTALGAAIPLSTGLVVGLLQELRAAASAAERARVLAEARARVVTADRLAALGTLTGGVAHGINNPMAWVSGNIDFAIDELAGEHPDLAEVRQALSDTRDGVRRMRGVLEDLTLLSRGGPGAGFTPIAPVESLRRLVGLADSQMKNARLELALTPVPDVRATEAHLAHIVLNLLRNASDAMPPRRRELNTIFVRTRCDERGWVVIEVEDNGVGIAPEVAVRLFDPFFSTRESTKHPGLGLAVAHALATELGGELTFTSTPGQGSSFKVALPPAPVSASALSAVR